MAVDRFFEDLCRICVSGGSEGTMSIYSAEGRSHRLSDKISRFLSIDISEEDNLPKVVCKTCQDKLNSIESFRDLAMKSQTTLQKMAKTEDSPLSESQMMGEGCSIKEEPGWWSLPTTNIEVKYEEVEEASVPQITTTPRPDPAKDVPKGLLHSILTKGQTFQSSDITEMEVTVDPMLFFEEEDDEGESTEPTNVSSGSTIEGEVVSGHETLQRVSEPKPYQCYLCPRGFNSDLSLKSHLWNHLPSRKVLATSDLNRFELEASLRTRVFNSQCLCQECGRVYPSKSTLRAHQITHSNLRPHKCSLCDKTFKRNQDLKFHINQHTGERPYRCPYCPKAFASSGNCFSHRKRMHPKQLARDKKKNRR